MAKSPVKNKTTFTPDPDRLESAKRRANLALVAERRHLNAAKAERAKARTLARTWEFDLDDV